MKLARRSSDGQLISLVPMIDVMLILLVFFMVTSTYLNLDMIPFVQRGEAPAEAATGSGETSETSTFLVRIGADGRAFVRGQALDPGALTGFVTTRLAENPLLSVVILPSPQARTQDLVTTMDVLTSAGATRLRLMRLEARE